MKMKAGLAWAIAVAVLFVGLVSLGWLTILIAKKAAEQRSQTLTVNAQDAFEIADFESAARFSIAAINGREAFLIGFDSGKAEKILTDVVSKSPALNGRIYFKQSVDAVAYSPNGKYLATASGPNGIQIWDALTHKLLASAAPTDGMNVYSLVFTGDGQSLISDDVDTWTVQPTNYGEANLNLSSKASRIDSPAQILIAKIKNSDKETYLATSPDLSTVLTSNGRSLRIWDVASRTVTTPDWSREVELDHDVGMAWYAPNGKYIAVTSGTAVIIIDGKNFTFTGAIVRLNDNQNPWDAKFSPDGERLAIMPDPTTVQIFITSTMEAEGPLLRQIGVVSDVAFSPDGHTLAVAGGDWQVRFWDLKKSSGKGPDRKPPLRGRALIEEACRRVLQGEVSRFREQELEHTPLLNGKTDGDACRTLRMN
ncbi:WD40 repeat domain-containing protein [Asticcacaulis sp. ZE23SCel15]|uniref:WD40 repeat domain-containing protein n=1 Tax=Asticcacaulis sp. ZE23SCel15 TaxID=3059027 RepID=UPI00265F6351|nr:WD40 repeat domain-containing protein [Asticcacaulis sp. ZE23SCel15]WKL56549.1 WD40 repeat domain-containing protein [Asticcacaulis sp. ZE23SCel15]